MFNTEVYIKQETPLFNGCQIFWIYTGDCSK